MLALPLVGSMLPSLARAEQPQESGWHPSAAFVQLGVAQSTRQVSGGLDWDWARQWTVGGGRLSGYWEVSASGWSYPTVDGHRTAWLGQLGLVPVLRYRFDGGASPWFVEGGIGLTMTTTIYESERKRFSSNFNFGDHIGLGRSVGETKEDEVALRIEHFSNGGIKHPNPGENFIELRYTRRFR